MKKQILATALLTCITVVSVYASAAEPPPPPPLEIPDLTVKNPPILCVDCAPPFDTATHKRVLGELASNPYLKQLRLALYKQDIVHQFESRAHFDNCDFESSTRYIKKLLEDVEGHVSRAETAVKNDQTLEFTNSVEEAYFSLGQALHGVQDFYAHTNYIELQVSSVKKVTDIPLITPWKKDGLQVQRELQDQGLVSGVVWWGFPKRCAAGTANHGELAKDSATTTSGKIRVKHLQNISQYRIAEFLARESSLALITDAYARWPILREASGNYISFETMVDRRETEKPDNAE